MQSSAFARPARGALGYNLLVILFGALVLAPTLVDAAVGAGPVRPDLVADNDSLPRAVVLGVHLLDTLLLLAALALAASCAMPTPRRLNALALRAWLTLATTARVAAGMVADGTVPAGLGAAAALQR